jgi:hypothetical protein
VGDGTLRLAHLYGDGDSEFCGLTATGAAHCWSMFSWNGAGPITTVATMRTKRFRTLSAGRPFCGIAMDGRLYCGS